MKYGYKCIGSIVDKYDANRSTQPTKKMSVFWKSSRGIEAWCSGCLMEDLNYAFSYLPTAWKTSEREYYYVVEVYEE